MESQYLKKWISVKPNTSRKLGQAVHGRQDTPGKVKDAPRMPNQEGRHHITGIRARRAGIRGLYPPEAEGLCV